MKKDPHLFLEVLEKHKKLIYKVANLYCQEEMDRQDVVQEIILQLWSSFEKYDPAYKYSTFIYRIALNTAISFYRKKTKRSIETVKLDPVIYSTLVEGSDDSKNSNLNLLMQFIKELKELDKAIMLLYLEGLKYREIAEVTGISSTHVSTRISRIKEFLKQKFNKLTSFENE